MLTVAGLTGACQSDRDVIVVAESAVAAPAPVNRPRRADSEEVSPRVLRRFAPLAAGQPAAPPAVVDLGRLLYYEPRLSRTGTVACNSCHPLDTYGTTPTRFATGIAGATSRRNAPSTYHAAGHFRQYWDGRTATLVEQAAEPILAAREMGMTPDAVVARLRASAGYRTAFARAYPGDPQPITMAHVADAIAAFERGLVTPSPWDRYLAGDRAALTREEKEGAKLFANLGCIVCHAGPYIGGSMFEKVGARNPWPDQADRGRFDITRNMADDMMFKVPSLRNVARTPPYFHDGSAATLEDAIRMMAVHQLGVDLDAAEIRELMVWLNTLTGELPRQYIERRPLLPDGE